MQCNMQTAMHSDDIISKFLLHRRAEQRKMQHTLLLGMNSNLSTAISYYIYIYFLLLYELMKSFVCQDCKMLVPRIGYNKYLIPPPFQNESFTYIDLISNVRDTIYIDEVEKIMRLKKQNTRFWFNSYLTFQNLKRESDNLIQTNDKDNMWIPKFEPINSESLDHCKRTFESETFLATPTQNHVLNDKTDMRNAFLFEVRIALYAC